MVETTQLHKSVPNHGSNAKKVKFEDVQKQLASQFPSMDVNRVITSKKLETTFSLTF